jgi:Subtilase family/Concanavalin A-like lectin/glucanases superfamily
MSQKEYNAITRQLKPFFTLLVVVASSLFLASCGGGSGSPADSTATVSSSDSSTQEGTARALAVSGGTVPGGWSGRVPVTKPYTNLRTYSVNESIVVGEITGVKYIKGEIYIIIKQATDLTKLKNYCQAKSFSIVYLGGPEGRDFAIQTGAKTEAALESIIKEIDSLEFIFSATKNKRSNNQPFQASAFSDFAWKTSANRWALESIKFPLAFVLTQSQSLDPNVGVHVLDDGFVGLHDDLAFASRFGENIVNTSSNWHGTATSGIISAKINNSLTFGATGIAPSAKLGVSNFLDADSDDQLDFRTFITLGSSAERAFRVINMSFGVNQCKDIDVASGVPASCPELATTTDRIELYKLIKNYAFYTSPNRSPDNSKLVVKASGNYGEYPLGYPTVRQGEGIPVPAESTGGIVGAIGLFEPLNSDEASAVDRVNNRLLVVGASFRDPVTGLNRISQLTQVPGLGLYGSEKLKESFILAPGGDANPINEPPRPEVTVLWGSRLVEGCASNCISQKIGTSFAAPHVAGVSTLIFQINPSFSAEAVREIILTTADRADGTQWKSFADGYRFLNAEAAVKEAIRRKNEANCGTVSAPFIKTTGQLVANQVIAGQAVTFTTTPSIKTGSSFARYDWKTSENFLNSAFFAPDIAITFNNPTTPPLVPATISVTPVLADGTVCTGSTATSQVTVQAPAGPTDHSFAVEMSAQGISRAGGLITSGLSYEDAAFSGIGVPAVKFSGGRVIIPNNASIQFDARGMTMTAKVRIDSTTGMTGYGSYSSNRNEWVASIMAKSHDRTGAALSMVGTYRPFIGTFDGTWSSGGGCISEIGMWPNLPMGQWVRVTYIASRFSGTAAYVNGMIAWKCPNATPDFTSINSQDLHIGRFGDGFWYPMPGAIADIKIWQRALSAAEVSTLN